MLLQAIVGVLSVEACARDVPGRPIVALELVSGQRPDALEIVRASSRQDTSSSCPDKHLSKDSPLTTLAPGNSCASDRAIFRSSDLLRRSRRLHEFLRSHDRRLHRQYLFHQHTVDFTVHVSARVRHHDHGVVHISRPANRG